MKPIGEKLEKALDPTPKTDIATILYFDYQADSYRWASSPEIAACLADYLHQVSAAHKAVGGNGKVMVVAHSMGGLAVRFATDKRYAANPAGDVLAGVVTLDTPYLGSPFGNQVVARGAEVLLGAHAQAAWPFPKPGTDGSICLSLHAVDIGLPSGCAKAPYLPVTVPLTQVAGDVVVSRTLFGIPLYDIDLASDGIVGSGSSQGYPESGPAGEKAPSGSKVMSRPMRCKMAVDEIQNVAVTQGLIQNGAKGAFANFVATVGSNVFTDTVVLNELLAGERRMFAVQFLLAAQFGAACSHTGILSYGEALTDTADALRGFIQQLSQPDAKTVFAPYVGDDWHVHGASLTIRADFTGEMKVAGAKCDPASEPQCLGHVKLQFSVEGQKVTAKIVSADFSDEGSGTEVGNAGLLEPGPFKGVIKLVFKGATGGNPYFCGKDADPASDAIC